jgi:hypothetical protein
MFKVSMKLFKILESRERGVGWAGRAWKRIKCMPIWVRKPERKRLLWKFKHKHFTVFDEPL